MDIVRLNYIATLNNIKPTPEFIEIMRSVNCLSITELEMLVTYTKGLAESKKDIMTDYIYRQGKLDGKGEMIG